MIRFILELIFNELAEESYVLRLQVLDIGSTKAEQNLTALYQEKWRYCKLLIQKENSS